MRYFSYRNKMRLRTLLITSLWVLAGLCAVAIGIFLYLQRYVVYTPDGAHLDFSLRPGYQAPDDSPANPSFVVEQTEASSGSDVVIQEETQEDGSVSMTRISGFYVTGAMLAQPDAVADVLSALTEPTAVMVDVKSIYGNFYYPSAVSGAEASTLVDPAAVQKLFETLNKNENLYLIACLPAFRDSAFALSNQECGLPLSSGALWMDSESCYWLDPSNDKVLSYLESLVLELQSMGFDEAALDDFYLPDSANIAFDGDRSGVIVDAAKKLSENLDGEEIRLSLYGTDPALAPYAARLYVKETDGAKVQSIAEAFSAAYTPLEDHLVFVTDSRDTRFSKYGVLMPAIESAAE